MYLDSKGQVAPHLSTKGYLAVGVPGTVKGLDYVTTYGTRSRQQVMEAAITLAKQGFILQAADAALLKQHSKTFKTQSNVASIFLKSGRPYQTSDRLIQSNLAKSLHSISQQGADAFYRGAIASSLVQASDRQGGIYFNKSRFSAIQDPRYRAA
jgi:gamma-glutamyltranspeptidase/glutathione hydrolase